MSAHTKTPKNRLAKLALDRAKSAWGVGWNELTPTMRDAFLAREAVAILLGQADESGAMRKAKTLVAQCMGWKNEEEPA